MNILLHISKNLTNYFLSIYKNYVRLHMVRPDQNVFHLLRSGYFYINSSIWICGKRLEYVFFSLYISSSWISGKSKGNKIVFRKLNRKEKVFDIKDCNFVLRSDHCKINILNHLEPQSSKKQTAISFWQLTIFFYQKKKEIEKGKEGKNRKQKVEPEIN